MVPKWAGEFPQSWSFLQGAGTETWPGQRVQQGEGRGIPENPEERKQEQKGEEKPLPRGISPVWCHYMPFYLLPLGNQLKQC